MHCLATELDKVTQKSLENPLDQTRIGVLFHGQVLVLLGHELKINKIGHSSRSSSIQRSKERKKKQEKKKLKEKKQTEKLRAES